MGYLLFDQYTYLHFAVGIITYFFDIHLTTLILFHTVFEFSENTQFGMNVINTYMPFWPGGKPKADGFLNMFGDTIGVVLGWITAYLLDYYGSMYHWYDQHII